VSKAVNPEYRSDCGIGANSARVDPSISGWRAFGPRYRRAVSIGSAGSIAYASTDNEAVALSLVNLLRAASKVVSGNQALINDHTVGFKDVATDKVGGAARELHKEKTGDDIGAIDRSTLHGRLVQAELNAIVDVVDDVQERINRVGVGFKGFLPAIFAADVASRFQAKANQAARLKLTAPESFVRNPVNSPDGWESGVIEYKFKSPGYPTGQYVTAQSIDGGKPAFRLILPEYYNQSCLSCHGGPKGSRDITGGIKEGGKPGDLGGAISVVIFNK